MAITKADMMQFLKINDDALGLVIDTLTAAQKQSIIDQVSALIKQRRIAALEESIVKQTAELAELKK